MKSRLKIIESSMGGMMAEIHKGNDNGYRDLKVVDAESMHIKARLASKIGKII